MVLNVPASDVESDTLPLRSSCIPFGDVTVPIACGLSRLKRATIEGMMLPASVVGEIGNSISGLVVACPWPDVVSHLYSHRATHWTDRRHGRNQATLH